MYVVLVLGVVELVVVLINLGYSTVVNSCLF